MLISEYINKYLDKHYGENSQIHSLFSDIKYDDCELSLRVCPICGGTAKLILRPHSDGYCSSIVASIACSNCGLRTDDRCVDGYYGDTHIVNDIIGYWNHRPLFDDKKPKVLALSQDQMAKYSFWRDNHECKFRKGGIRCIGAVGGADTFHITGTGLGEIVEVECACGEKLDLTEDF